MSADAINGGLCAQLQDQGLPRLASRSQSLLVGLRLMCKEDGASAGLTCPAAAGRSISCKLARASLHMVESCLSCFRSWLLVPSSAESARRELYSSGASEAEHSRSSYALSLRAGQGGYTCCRPMQGAGPCCDPCSRRTCIRAPAMLGRCSASMLFSPFTSVTGWQVQDAGDRSPQGAQRWQHLPGLQDLAGGPPQAPGGDPCPATYAQGELRDGQRAPLLPVSCDSLGSRRLLALACGIFALLSDLVKPARSPLARDELRYFNLHPSLESATNQMVSNL